MYSKAAMSPARPLFIYVCSLLCLGLAGRIEMCASTPTTLPVEGIRTNKPKLHALTDCRIVVAPGQVIENGTLLIRQGIIERVGADVEVPREAKQWTLTGKTIYAGFIDAYSEVGLKDPDDTAGSPYWNKMIQPQCAAAELFAPDGMLNEKLRSQGIAARLVVPKFGIIKGRSALVSTGDGPSSETLLASPVALHIRLTTDRNWADRTYPNSPMGAVALARQAMYDADWYQKAWQTYRTNSALEQPEWNDSLHVLQDYFKSDRLIVIDADNEQFLLRADRFAREFGLKIALRGSGHEYRRLEAVRQTGRTIVVPLHFPKAPQVTTLGQAQNVTLEELMHWDFAPENPGRLDQAGVRIAITSHGLEDVNDFLASVRTAVQRGLGKEAALRALTTRPAELLGAAEQVGTLDAGKIANIVVADGDLFEKDTRLSVIWVQGTRYDVAKLPAVNLRGSWRIRFHPFKTPTPCHSFQLTGKPDKLEGHLSVELPGGEQQQSKLEHVTFEDSRLTTRLAGESLGVEGVLRMTALVQAHRGDATSAAGSGDISWTGEFVYPDGRHLSFTCSPALTEDGQRQFADTEHSETEDQPPFDRTASFPVNYPLGAFGRNGQPAQPEQILFQGATIWSCGPEGVLQNASLLVGQGKVLAVGTDLDVPPDIMTVDARGKHITPGIIDCHSHMASDGGINESGQAITAEVRIGDFVDSRDIAIYHQLAGGVTCASILHGSANPIGGQNQVIKLRWGAAGEGLKFSLAPQGIKFALGENVKQSNWGEKFTTRYPQTRMGVEQIIRDAFHSAQQYRLRWRQWEDTRRGLPPRKDLELDAIAEILEGERWIHCHAYRQDEMLALLRTLEEYEVTIGTLQHVLEGYKIADAMARHGAMGSAFSDWWAYKFEVYDAIPYNGALMYQAGVCVSFNSDSRELGRHLNQEAAKAVKYGGVPQVEALKFVTLNPARQLRIDNFVGSLETGKQADFVIWSGPPLSNFSLCEQTWIEGRKYFDRQVDLKLRTKFQAMHNTLVQKILRSKAPMINAQQKDKEQPTRHPRGDCLCRWHWR